MARRGRPKQIKTPSVSPPPPTKKGRKSMPMKAPSDNVRGIIFRFSYLGTEVVKTPEQFPETAVNIDPSCLPVRDGREEGGKDERKRSVRVLRSRNNGRKEFKAENGGKRSQRLRRG